VRKVNSFLKKMTTQDVEKVQNHLVRSWMDHRDDNELSQYSKLHKVRAAEQMVLRINMAF